MPGMMMSPKSMGKTTGLCYPSPRDFGSSRKSARRTLRTIEKRVAREQMRKET
jgi:hypothetical protein